MELLLQHAIPSVSPLNFHRRDIRTYVFADIAFLEEKLSTEIFFLNNSMIKKSKAANAGECNVLAHFVIESTQANNEHVCCPNAERREEQKGTVDFRTETRSLSLIAWLVTFAELQGPKGGSDDHRSRLRLQYSCCSIEVSQ